MEAIKPACWQSLGGHSLTKAREAHHRKVLGEAAALFTKDISICLFEDSIPLASSGNPLTGTHLCLTAEAAADSPWPLSHSPCLPSKTTRIQLVYPASPSCTILTDWIGRKAPALQGASALSCLPILFLFQSHFLCRL